MNHQPSWEKYEEAARSLLGQIGKRFGLEEVQGKQVVSGESGASWEIDGRGIKIGGDGFVIIECRRYTTSKLKQEDIGAIAFRIKDTGADGAIVVTPIGLQAGAEKIATHAHIVTVRLTPESDALNYVMSFLNEIFVGLSETITITDTVDIKIIRANGSNE